MFRFKWVELSCISWSTVQFVRHAQDSMRCIIATETLGKLCSFHFSMFFHSRAAGHGGMPLKYRHRMWPQLLRTSSAEFEKLLDVQLPNKALQRSWKVNVGQCWEMSELSKKNPSDLAFQNYERGGRHMQHWLGWLGCWVSFSPSGAPHCVKVKEQIDADVPRTRRLAFRHSVDFEICCKTQHGHVRNSLVAGRHTELQRVLHALGAHRPEIGYAQGMWHGKIWKKLVNV